MHLELNRTSIATLVHDFYTDVQGDVTLNAIFNARIGNNWAPHMARMTDFWCSVMLGTGDYKGNVFGKHMLVENVEFHHFRRWLDLFSANVRRLFAPEVADQFVLVARRIAGSLQYGYFGHVEVQ